MRDRLRQGIGGTSVRLTATVLGVLLALSAAPSTAGAEAWRREGNRLSTSAGIVLPASPAGLSLQEATEFSQKGTGLDNVVQYSTPDKAIQGTAYVYRPAYADAALTAMQTGRVIEARFGAGIELHSSSVIQAGGEPNGAIRRIYDHRAQGRTTTAAFMRAGDWIVKLRVSGPYSRRDEIIAALDALIAGIELPAEIKVHPAAELQLGECPAPTSKKARRLKISNSLGIKSDPMMEALLSGALLSVSAEKAAAGGRQTIARNGLQPLCVRDRIRIDNWEIPLLQPVGGTEGPEAIVAVFSDSGGVLELPKREGGYALLVHEIGKTTSYGAYQQPPSPEQLAAVLTGKDEEVQPQSVTNIAADGKINNEIFISK